MDTMHGSEVCQLLLAHPCPKAQLALECVAFDELAHYGSQLVFFALSTEHKSLVYDFRQRPEEINKATWSSWIHFAVYDRSRTYQII